MADYRLKYLYRAIYTNGRMYDQNVKDISVANPDKSCYHDLKIDNIQYFILSDGVTNYSLDLLDGGLSVNNSAKFYLSTDQLTDFKLVHYRRVTMDIIGDARKFTVNYVLGYVAKNGSGDEVTNSIIIK